MYSVCSTRESFTSGSTLFSAGEQARTKRERKSKARIGIVLNNKDRGNSLNSMINLKARGMLLFSLEAIQLPVDKSR